MNDLGRIRWQCRRGMLELDVLLQDFLADHWEGMPQSERRAFERMLAYPDTVLLECLLGRLPVLDPEIAHVVAQIRQIRQHPTC